MLFLCFERIRMGEKSAKWTMALAPFAFGVYLVHGHSVIYRQLGWRFHSYLQLPVWGMGIAVVLTAAVIYLICTLVDWLRSLLFKALRLERMAEWIAIRLTAAADYVGKICE